MKEYVGKDLAGAIDSASIETGYPVETISYYIVDQSDLETKIMYYGYEDVIDCACQYVLDILAGLQIEASIDPTIKDGVITLNLSSEQSARIIGRGGQTLKALTDLTRLAVSTKFKTHKPLLIDVEDYKEQKYAHIISMARRLAKDVKMTGVAATMSNLTSDERRVVHNALSNDPKIKTLSLGVGKDRKLTIEYVKSTEVSGAVECEKHAETTEEQE